RRTRSRAAGRGAWNGRRVERSIGLADVLRPRERREKGHARAARASAPRDGVRRRQIRRGGLRRSGPRGHQRWRRNVEDPRRHQPRRRASLSGIRKTSHGLRAFSYVDGPDAPLDVAGAKLGALEQAKEVDNEPSLLKWVRTTGRDPLEVAAEAGV